MKKLFENNRQNLRYMMVGTMASAINMTTFILLSYLFGVNYLISNGIAWALTVIVAYVADKIWVFHSAFGTPFAIVKEFAQFCYTRVFSGAVDMLLMWGLIGFLGFPKILVKIGNSCVVVVLNFILLKLFVFQSADHKRHH